jgi:CDP-diacylglycerol--glycerol-3-phosphate 3-phosphatidyltransferase
MVKHIPNILTVSRILLIPMLVSLYFVEPRTWWPVGLYFLICITDFFDGYLARKLNAYSAFGAFLDPVADKLLVSTLLLMLVADFQQWYVTLPAMLIIAREVTMSALREWMAKRNLSDVVAVDTLGKYKTTVQMFSLAFLMAPGSGVFLTIGLVLLYVATILTVYSLVRYIIKAYPAQNTNSIIHHTI